MNLVIGLGEYAISNDTNATIKTYALASCVGVTVYSPFKRVGGMAHIVLPRPFDNHFINPKPAYYASTGIPLLINKMLNDYKCFKSELIVQIYGGANSVNENDLFRVGKKNLDEVFRLLDNMNINKTVIDIGESYSRTIELDIGTGNVNLSRQLLKI
jgi:chemotaxis protein CheD